MVASKYGTMIQGCTALALTKMDVLSYLDQIPVCTAYEVDGKRITDFPSGEELRKATPVYEYMEGWKCDISGCRTMEEMPEKAVKYIKYIEEQVGCPIQYVSVGAEREEYIKVF